MYSHVSSPVPYIYVCVCVCVQPKKKKRNSVLSNHPISVQCDNEKGFITYSATLTVACSFGVKVWVYSLISSPSPTYFLCVCVCLTNKKKKKKRKKLSVVKLSHISKVWYWEGIYYLLPTLTTAYSFGVGMWVYSLISSPFPDTYVCLCVVTKEKEKRYSVLSSRPTSVMCDIE